MRIDFKKFSNFEKKFYPQVIKKNKANFEEINGFWHSIDNYKDIGDLNEKKLALIVILIRACLGIDSKTLTHIGQPALRLGLIPGILEACLVAYASSMLFQIPPIEAFIFGWVIAAVSPAVIVPQMLTLKEMGYGQVR